MGKFQVPVGRKKKTDVKTRLGVRGAGSQKTPTRTRPVSARLGTPTRSPKPLQKSSIDGKWTHDMFQTANSPAERLTGPSRSAARGGLRAVAVPVTRSGGAGVFKQPPRLAVRDRLGSAVAARGGRLASVVVAPDYDDERPQRSVGSRAVTITNVRGGGGGGVSDHGVGELLGSLGLGKYTGVFAREEVDLDALSCMTESDLQLLGIPMGPRKKILQACQ